MTDQDQDREKGSSPELGCENFLLTVSSVDSREMPPKAGGESTRPQPNQKDMLMMIAMYKNMVKDGKRAMVRVKRQNDAKLNSIMSELMLLESRLRQEQSQFCNQITIKDSTIMMQSQEIERLRRDNRRLITRLKKVTDHKSPTKEFPLETESSAHPSHTTKKSPSKSRDGGCDSSKDERTYSSTTENRSTKSAADFSAFAVQYCNSKLESFNNKINKHGLTGRVCHKPPIAEKPKLSRQAAMSLVAIDDRECNIVSTISRLLEEESDQGVSGVSGSSEPSSPEATLKPTTPRVIRLARQYEKGGFNTLLYSSDQSRVDDSSIKSMIMDEYEVTSGYNSDAFSEQEHDYENMTVLHNPGNEVCDQLEGDDEDENYVILEAVSQDNNTVMLQPPLCDDQHPIYSNIEYQNGVESKTVDEEDYETVTPRDSLPSTPEKNLLLETDLDNSDTSSESTLSDSPRHTKNIPRSRQNINLLMDTGGESHILQNFEEFTLDSLDLEKDHQDTEELRHSGDGAEAMNLLVNKDVTNLKDAPWNLFSSSSSLVPGCGYDKFLEVTGLSDKSILSPSRMLSNHRSMLKPRDIKHRDKLRSAFSTLSTLEEVPQNDASGTIRYSKEQCYL